ncbi:MAG: cyclase family protein [Actinomycetes bacterium]
MAVHELSHLFENGMPQYFAVPPFLHVFQRRLGDVVRPGGVTIASDLLVAPIHAGTHVDAPAHVAVPPVEATPPGAETIPPLVARGVLLDCRDAGVQELGVAEVERALERAGTAVRPGDVVLVATGWEARWSHGDYASMEAFAQTPGLGVEAARLLVDAGAIAIGADNATLEPASTQLGVHRLLLHERGVYIIENLRLSTLLEEGAHLFAFLALPLRIAGGTGSPIRAVAVTGDGWEAVVRPFARS